MIEQPVIEQPVIEQSVIHYVFQADPERIACMPNMTEFHSTPHHPHYQRTNEPRAVACPSCKKTDAYKSAKENNA